MTLYVCVCECVCVCMTLYVCVSACVYVCDECNCIGSAFSVSSHTDAGRRRRTAHVLTDEELEPEDYLNACSAVLQVVARAEQERQLGYQFEVWPTVCALQTQNMTPCTIVLAHHEYTSLIWSLTLYCPMNQTPCTIVNNVLAHYEYPSRQLLYRHVILISRGIEEVWDVVSSVLQCSYH